MSISNFLIRINDSQVGVYKVIRKIFAPALLLTILIGIYPDFLKPYFKENSIGVAVWKVPFRAIISQKDGYDAFNLRPSKDSIDEGFYVLAIRSSYYPGMGKSEIIARLVREFDRVEVIDIYQSFQGEEIDASAEIFNLHGRNNGEGKTRHLNLMMNIGSPGTHFVLLKLKNNDDSKVFYELLDSFHSRILNGRIVTKEFGPVSFTRIYSPMELLFVQIPYVVEITVAVVLVLGILLIHVMTSQQLVPDTD